MNRAFVNAATMAATCLLTIPALHHVIGAQAEAAEFYEDTKHPDTIIMDGDIEKEDDSKLFKLLGDRTAQGVETKAILLNSEGGLVYPASVMAYLIRGKHLATIVPRDSLCASACVLMFAAGTSRYAYEGPRLGVHNAWGNAASADGAQQMAIAGDITIGMAKILADFGAPDSVIALMAVTSPNSMTWLKEEDVAGWAEIVHPEPAVAPAPPPLPAPERSNRLERVPMTCLGEKGYYSVVWTVHGPGKSSLFAGKRTFAVDGVTKKSENEYVVYGPTRYGDYSAVFSSSQSYIVFRDRKGDTAIDYCRSL